MNNIADNYSAKDWTEPGLAMGRRGSGGRIWYFIWMLVVPPKGHRTAPTSAGFIVILVSLGLGSAAYNTASNILFMALSLLLSTFILSGLLSWINFKGILWRLVLPNYFRVGEPATIDIDLLNSKTLLPTYSLWFNVSTALDKQKERVHLEERLDAGKQVRLHWEYIPRKRGLEKLDISGVESQFPFGFLRKTIGGREEREVVVFPDRVEYEFSPATAGRYSKQGESVLKKGGSSELLNLRHYQPGDPQKRVHWKASARMRTLMVKQTADENRDGFYICVDSHQSIWSGEDLFERLCRFVASLAEDLFTEGRLLGYSINGRAVVRLRRLPDLLHFLEELSVLERVEHYDSAADLDGAQTITFAPGNLKKVIAYVGGREAGTA